MNTFEKISIKAAGFLGYNRLRIGKIFLILVCVVVLIVIYKKSEPVFAIDKGDGVLKIELELRYD